MNLNETEKYSLINTHLSSQFNYSTFLLMCKCFPSQMNALWSTLFVQINKENKDPFSHLCVCDRAALLISNHFFFQPFSQATFMVRLPPLGLAVFHLYESPDSPMTLRSDTLLRLSGRGVTARAVDPLPVRSQQSDPQTFYISSQSLTLGFSGTTGLLEVCVFIESVGFYICIKDLLDRFNFDLLGRHKSCELDFSINPRCLIKANMACLVAPQTSFHLLF